MAHLIEIGGYKSNVFQLDEWTFQRAGKAHDWRNHVPECLRLEWPRMSIHQRLLVAIVAHYAAMDEVTEKPVNVVSEPHKAL